MGGRGRKYVPGFLFLLALCGGCSKDGVVSPGRFTKEYAQALRQASPGVAVTIVRDLEIKVTFKGRRDATSFLYNAYDAYRRDPKLKDAIIRNYVTAAAEMFNTPEERPDKTRIVPVVKDRAWIADARKALIERGEKDLQEQVYEDLNADLVIAYALDSPKSIRYLTDKELAELKIARKDLRNLACKNLLRLLPKIECHGADGVYILTAGGSYEAGLLLIESIWNKKNLKVSGDFVVAIPIRGLLLVTGSDDAPGIERVKSVAKEALTEGTYPLTPKLFVYRRGKFEEFKK
jgi:uncharacterized protein YtpQ (UPF0354 family)